MKLQIKLGILSLIGMTIFSCSDDDNNEATVTKNEVIENYADIVYTSYKDSYDAAVAMQTKITAFTANPDQAKFDAAKDAWKAAREFYGQTEVYRGSNGPIDFEGADAPAWAISNEGQINAWPLDEGYIDYVKASSAAYAGSFNNSIISGTQAITKNFLAGANEGGGNIEDEDLAGKAISTGWHAVEFLLWGQDETNPSEKLEGQRKFTDYSTADHSDRRATYLNEVTELLVDDLKLLVDTWAEGGTYREVFMALDQKEALTNIVSGPHFLAAEELSNERMLASATSVAGIDGSGQEDEHSCFADYTHQDVYRNAQGVMNVLFGRYEDGAVSGASLYELIKQEDATKAASLKAAADKAWASVKLIDDAYNAGTPYDLLITQEGENNPGLVLNANQDLLDLGDVIAEAVGVFEINLY